MTRLVELLNSNEVSVITPALRAIGNIVTGDDSQTQCILDHGALPAFHNLLKHHKINIQKEAAWTISNITAGNTNQIQQVLDQQLLPPVLEILTKVGNPTNTAKALESFLCVVFCTVVQFSMDPKQTRDSFILWERFCGDSLFGS